MECRYPLSPCSLNTLTSSSISNSPYLPCSDPIPDFSYSDPLAPLTFDSLVSSPFVPPPSVMAPPPSFHTMITGGNTGIFKHKAYHALTFVPTSLYFQALIAIQEPHGFKSAIKHPEWLSMMDAEIQALKTNETWDLVPRPSHHNVVGCKWIFKTKLRADGSIERHKAYLVAQLFFQIHGLDFEDTFSPVVHPAAVQINLTLAVSSG
ncbi:putative mitochondrial protein [Abeliophyllum distichum]|uniref:Mitochondrial protein n=1 Tax=Abeliophyllum distichum TaxID=126358 RepID=A0ABD1Q7R5_9LAMI